MRATTQPFQKLLSDNDREFVRREKESRAKGIDADPVVVVDWNLPGEDERVRKWCGQALQTVRRKFEKLPKFQPSAHHDLLICNDADVPLFPGRERQEALSTIASAVKDLDQLTKSFRTVSVVMSLDVEYDIGRNRRLLVYRESEAS